VILTKENIVEIASIVAFIARSPICLIIAKINFTQYFSTIYDINPKFMLSLLYSEKFTVATIKKINFVQLHNNCNNR